MKINSLTLCRINLKSGLPAKCAMLSGEPVTQLSTAITLNPSAIRRSLKWDPRNPPPPVTTATFFEEVDSNIRFKIVKVAVVRFCQPRHSPTPPSHFLAQFSADILRRSSKFDRTD